MEHEQKKECMNDEVESELINEDNYEKRNFELWRNSKEEIDLEKGIPHGIVNERDLDSDFNFNLLKIRNTSPPGVDFLMRD